MPLPVPPRCIHRTHRLLAIQSTTPEELYERKLRLEEYGEALSLARAYGLDCDVVYQRQWERTPTSAASIRNYLVRVQVGYCSIHKGGTASVVKGFVPRVNACILDIMFFTDCVCIIIYHIVTVPLCVIQYFSSHFGPYSLLTSSLCSPPSSTATSFPSSPSPPLPSPTPHSLLLSPPFLPPPSPPLPYTAGQSEQSPLGVEGVSLHCTGLL